MWIFTHAQKTIPCRGSTAALRMQHRWDLSPQPSTNNKPGPTPALNPPKSAPGGDTGHPAAAGVCRPSLRLCAGGSRSGCCHLPHNLGPVIQWQVPVAGAYAYSRAARHSTRPDIPGGASNKQMPVGPQTCATGASASADACTEPTTSDLPAPAPPAGQHKHTPITVSTVVQSTAQGLVSTRCNAPQHPGPRVLWSVLVSHPDGQAIRQTPRQKKAPKTVPTVLSDQPQAP